MRSTVRDYRELYCDAFAALGHRLTRREGVAESRIATAERRLGIRVPKALRDYYLVAGRERQFNDVFNRLYAPQEWFLDGGKLAFMEENQAVVFWGVNATSQPRNDPAVYQGVNAEPVGWHLEHCRCSVFLNVMLHWHGAYGGALRWCQTAPLSNQSAERLRRSWTFVGEVNEMRAYSRPGQAVCVLFWDVPGAAEWRVFAGAVSSGSLGGIANELNLDWDGPGP